MKTKAKRKGKFRATHDEVTQRVIVTPAQVVDKWTHFLLLTLNMTAQSGRQWGVAAVYIADARFGGLPAAALRDIQMSNALDYRVLMVELPL